MANLGLLGALGGLGQGLTQVGKSWEERRERALEWARKLQADQEERAFRAQEREMDRQAIGERNAANIQARKDITDRTLSARAAEKQADRSFRSSESAKTRESQKELVRLRSSLERSNDAAAKRLADQLSADDVHAVQYGAPNEKGLSQVLTVTNSGKVVPTGRWVYPPANWRFQKEEAGDDL